MKYQLIDISQKAKLVKMTLIIFIIFVLFTFILTLYSYYITYFEKNDLTHEAILHIEFYTIAGLFLLFLILTILYYYKTHRLCFNNSSISVILGDNMLKTLKKKSLEITEISLNNKSITLYGCKSSIKIPFDFFLKNKIIVQIQSYNRFYPIPNIFNYDDFLYNGFEYIKNGYEKIPEKRRRKTMISLTFYINKKYYNQYLFDLSVSLSIMPLPKLKEMLDEWRNKYEKYRQQYERMKIMKGKRENLKISGGDR